MANVFKFKWIVIVVAVALVAGGFLFVRSKSADAQKSQITTATATREDFIKTVSSSGKTKAEKSVDLKFQTSGRLAWVGVKEGDHVNAYQAIASMDQREVQKNLTKALRDYSSQRNDFDEAQKVTYTGHTPADALNDTMKRILEKNQWDLDKAVLDVELDSLALEYATLITPIAGVVTHIDTPVAGVNITPATSVFTVVDPESMVFEANADETDIGNLSLGQKAQMTLDAYPDATFSGTISYISYSSQLSAGGATVFPVRMSFDKPENIRIGLNGDVTIDSVNEPNVIIVPLEAIREEDGGKYVYKKIGDKYVKTQIHTGMQNDSSVVITDGINEGDIVVTKGFTYIKSS